MDKERYEKILAHAREWGGQYPDGSIKMKVRITREEAVLLRDSLKESRMRGEMKMVL